MKSGKPTKIAAWRKSVRKSISGFPAAGHRFAVGTCRVLCEAPFCNWAELGDLVKCQPDFRTTIEMCSSRWYGDVVGNEFDSASEQASPPSVARGARTKDGMISALC